MDQTWRKRLVTTLLLILAVASVFHTWWYYQEHRVSIWLALEELISTITFPFKLAQLSAEDPVSEVPVPVHGVLLREIADTWGDARDQGRAHEGTDIFASRGTPVYAATRGFVVRTGYNQLGGVVVFTMGPGGIRYYYAHLDSIAEGIKPGIAVTTDTVIGFVGNTGNAETTPPHLHFGMYNRGPQNPYPFLVDR
ncbi:MAG TPA: M23 family metallopeptidase [Candidatus Paceibacterota bacterium]|nr:M23 family metallopeptidase [Candidatus Paceibacterota bacterium]